MAESSLRITEANTAIIYADFSAVKPRAPDVPARMTMLGKTSNGQEVAIEIAGSVYESAGNGKQYFTPQAMTINGEKVGDIENIRRLVPVGRAINDKADCDINGYCKAEPGLLSSINETLAKNPTLANQLTMMTAPQERDQSSSQAKGSISYSAASFVATNPDAALAQMMAANNNAGNGGFAQISGALNIQAKVDGSDVNVSVNGKMEYIPQKGSNISKAYFAPESLAINGKTVPIQTKFNQGNSYEIGSISLSQIAAGRGSVSFTDELQNNQFKGLMPNIIAEGIARASITMPQQAASPPAASPRPVATLNSPQLTVEDRKFITERVSAADELIKKQDKVFKEEKEKPEFYTQFPTVYVKEEKYKILEAALDGKEGISIKNTGRYQYEMNVNGENWKLREVEFSPHAVLKGVLDIQMFSIENPDKRLAIQMRENNLDPKEFTRLVAKANRDYDSQINDVAGAKDFDLSRTRPVAALSFSGFTKKEREETFNDDFRRASVMPGLLKEAGYNMVTDKQSWDVELLGANPKEQIKERISDLYDKGVRDFYITTLGHGSKVSMTVTYDDPKGNMRFASLKKDEMQEIIKDFPDAHITIDTVACYGGGMIGMMENFVDAPSAKPGRVTAISQTKEDLTNSDSGYQDLRFKLLNDMATGAPTGPNKFGEAHYRADDRMRKFSQGGADPELIKSQPGKKSVKTAELDTPQQSTPQDEMMASIRYDGEASMPSRGGMNAQSLPSNGASRGSGIV